MASTSVRRRPKPAAERPVTPIAATSMRVPKEARAHPKSVRTYLKDLREL
jgi:hypothetical protein